MQMEAVSQYKIGGYIRLSAQKEGILLQKHRDRNGRCIAKLFEMTLSGSEVDVTLPSPIITNASLRIRSAARPADGCCNKSLKAGKVHMGLSNGGSQRSLSSGTRAQQSSAIVCSFVAFC